MGRSIKGHSEDRTIDEDTLGWDGVTSAVAEVLASSAVIIVGRTEVDIRRTSLCLELAFLFE